MKTPFFQYGRLALLVSVAWAGCQKGTDPAVQKRLDELQARQEKLDQRVAQIEQMIKGPPEPDPTAVYAVPIAGDPYQGPEHAKVTLVEAFEFACPYCAQVAPTVDALLAQYPQDLKVVYKYYVVHEAAIPAGLAVCAAHAQGKYPQMSRLIWDKGFAERDLSPERLNQLAAEAGLDATRYQADVQSEACQQALGRNHEELTKVGVNGTPAFYVNGRFLSGAQPVEAFKSLIDEELRKADEAIAQGDATVATYYDKAVLERGKPSL